MTTYKALGNGDAGVLIDNGADENTIGGTTAGARNVISGNVNYGVNIQGVPSGYVNNYAAQTEKNVVEGNYIGTDVDGNYAVGDGDAGVYINYGR